MIPALIRARYYSDQIVVTLWNRSARLPAHGKGTTGKGSFSAQHLLANICPGTLSSWVLSEQEEGGFQQNFSVLTAEDVIFTWIQPHPASSGVCAWGCKRSRLFYFASWAPGWRCCNSVGFFGWTRIFLKTSLRVFKANPWNFLAALLPFLQSFVQLSIVLCFSRTFFSVWWEDESADCRRHSFGEKMFSLDIDTWIFLCVLVRSIHILSKSY